MLLTKQPPTNRFHPCEGDNECLCYQVPWDYLTPGEKLQVYDLCPVCNNVPWTKRATEYACRHGHPWTKRTTIFRKTKSGDTYKVCRTCVYRSQKRYRRRQANGGKANLA